MLKKIAHEVRYVRSAIREKSKSKKRSSQWDDVRDDFIEKNPYCAACGSRARLQVHHILPFHTHPELELVESNLIVLCMDVNDCHLEIGHGGSFKNYNPLVKEHAEAFTKTTSPDERRAIVESSRSSRK